VKIIILNLTTGIREFVVAKHMFSFKRKSTVSLVSEVFVTVIYSFLNITIPIYTAPEYPSKVFDQCLFARGGLRESIPIRKTEITILTS